MHANLCLVLLSPQDLEVMPNILPTHLILAIGLVACTDEPTKNQPDGDTQTLPADPDDTAPAEESESTDDTGTPADGEDTATPDEDEPVDDSGEPTGEEPPMFVKSPKRGLSYNLLDAADFHAIESSVSWWYNWYFRTDTTADFEDTHEMQFVPMLWGHNPESDYVDLESWVLDHPKVEHLLVMNEPNLVDQANITPTEAVAHWLRYEQFQTDMLESHGREIALVGPAITWGTMAGFEDPVAWMDAFYEAFMTAEGREPRIDTLAFHWYDYGLDGQLTNLEKYGKDFWVTEMANWHIEEYWVIDTPEKQIETMTEMVNICETRADVERYAWFMGRWDPDPHHTSIFGDTPGELTAVGESYLDQPW